MTKQSEKVLLVLTREEFDAYAKMLNDEVRSLSRIVRDYRGDPDAASWYSNAKMLADRFELLAKPIPEGHQAIVVSDYDVSQLT